jgi:hypothetical protein
MSEATYIEKLVNGFESAVKVLWHEQLKPREFASIAIELQRLNAMEPPANFWDKWPMQPTTFPLYFRAGYSALDLAAGFCQSIDGCIQIAKVKTVGMPSDYNALADEELARWINATIGELACICTLATGVDRFREVDLFRRKIDCEMAEWSKCQKPDEPSCKQPNAEAEAEHKEKRKQTSKWAAAIAEYLTQSESPTDFARKWVSKSPRRINKMNQDFGSIEAAAKLLRDAIRKALKTAQ